MPSTHPIQKLAKTLLYKNASGRTWRSISNDYPGVNFATLNRIANSNGKWVPKDKRIQSLLGLTPEKRQPVKLVDLEAAIQRSFARYARKYKKSAARNEVKL